MCSVLFQLAVEKSMDASKFASFWELDENDVDEVSMEEIQSIFF